MPTLDARFHRHARPLVIALLCLLGVLGCEDDQAPTPQPATLQIVSGDDQYTRKGTQLEESVVVRVGLDGGAPAGGVEVQFRVTGGGGSLTRSAATTGSDGRSYVKWTMGPGTGTNEMRITVPDNSGLSATATATASEYYCVEEDPAFTPKFFSTHDVMMLTSASSQTTGETGLVRYTVNQNGTFTALSIENYPGGSFPYVVRDLVFSTNGDLFISWNHLHDEVMKVAADGSASHFATLESSSGAEIAMTPNGVLVGCDEMGPFYVTCRDTLFRFEDAIFSGDMLIRDTANNDALACDPTNGDVYFIYKQDRWLYRIPFDGTTTGAKAKVVQLPIEESDGARGMVVDGTDGSIYILVESATVKSIVKVTSAGVKTTQYDFFDRGAGDAAGIQSDLGIDRDPNLRYLYTLDTKNNKILLYPLIQQTLIELPSDGDPFAASNAGSNERVGLDVINVP